MCVKINENMCAYVKLNENVCVCKNECVNQNIKRECEEKGELEREEKEKERKELCSMT